MEWGPIPTDVEQNLRKICLALPETYEEDAGNGFRWMIRKRNFAQVFCIDEGEAGLKVMILFRSDPPELDALLHIGHPFFTLGWGNNVIGVLIDGDTDWEEVAELMADSYCIRAPKKLAAIVGDVTPRQ